MPKCLNCGVENPVGVGICKSCGGQIAIIETTQPDAAINVFEEEILGLIRDKKKIEAIKLYREKTGVDLKEANDNVEALAKKYNIESSGAGCAGVVLIVIAAVMLLLKYA